MHNISKCMMIMAILISIHGAHGEVPALRDLPFDVIDREFRNPSNHYRMIQYTGHGSPVAPVEKMREYGIGGIMFFMGSHQYLRNEDAWNVMTNNIRLAKEAGMQVWVGDDNGYPSGTAGGLVVEANPAYEVRGLLQLIQAGQGPQAIRMDLPTGIEHFVSAMVYPIKDGVANLDAGLPARIVDGHVEADGMEGPWTLSAFALKIINEGTQAMQTKQQFGTSGRYANLLSPGAMETFVALTHAEYAKRLGALEGKVDLFYTNEPNLMTVYFDPGSRPGGEAYVSWDTSLPGRFREAHGYDLMPRLGALFGGDTDSAKLTRRHFHETVGDMLTSNFTGRIAKWVETNGVRSGGHMLLEEYMAMHVICSGDYLKAISEQDVPGCDIPMPDEGEYWNYWMPKYVSSAAFLRGREMVSALLDPLIGRPKPILEPTPIEFRRIINMAYLAGVNQISTYILWEKYDPAIYRGFNEYAGRLAAMLRGAENASSIGMYYPIETFQSYYLPSPEFWSPIAWKYLQTGLQETQDSVARALFEHGYDFTYLTGDAILAAEIRDGAMIIRDHAFTTLMMPWVELLPLPVLRKLEAFTQAGGTVFWVNKTPNLGDAPEEHALVREAMANSTVVTPEEAVSRIKQGYPESFRIKFDEPPTGFFTGRYTRGGRPLYYMVNNTNAQAALTLRADGDAMVKVYNPMDGAVTHQPSPVELKMEPYASLIVVEE